MFLQNQVTTSTTKIAKQFNLHVCDNLAVEIPPADKEPKNDLNGQSAHFINPYSRQSPKACEEI